MKLPGYKPKILGLSHFYVTDNRAGGEVYLHKILKSLIPYAQVDAFATNNHTPNEAFEDIMVYKGPQHFARLKKYDLIITQFQEAKRVIPLANKLKIPVIFIAHNDLSDTDFVINNLKPDLIVFNSQWIKDKYNYKGNSIVVHPPVNLDQHRTTRGDKITLVNLIPSKGAYMFYNMASRFKDQQFLGVKGGYFPNQQVIKPSSNVQIIDNVKDMKTVWSKTKILLMPSTYESYGLVGVEALASGIPTIANPTPGLKESLGYAGIFPESTLIGYWKQAINYLLNEDNYKKQSALCLKRASEIDSQKELDSFVQKALDLL